MSTEIKVGDTGHHTRFNTIRDGSGGIREALVRVKAVKEKTLIVWIMNLESWQKDDEGDFEVSKEGFQKL